MSNEDFSKVLQELKKDPNYKPMNENEEIKMCTSLNKIINSEILFPSHNFTPHVLKMCCLCDNNGVKSIREIVDDKIVITYYCKEHNPLKMCCLCENNDVKSKELVKEINTQNKCDNCNYKITSNKKYKQCQVCKSVSTLNYLEECYGLNYKDVIEKGGKHTRK